MASQNQREFYGDNRKENGNYRDYRGHISVIDVPLASEIGYILGNIGRV